MSASALWTSMASLDGSYIDSEGMKQDLNKLLHLSCSVFYLYLMYFDWTKLTWPDRPIVDKLNKFTNWNYGVLTFYWLLCTANDHLQIEWLSIYLHDLAFGIILPCSVVVCLGFWSMSSVDPKMVRSEGFYKYIGKCPFWYSHGTHTLVLFLPILETWLGSASARVESLHIQEFFRDVSLVGAVVNWRKIHLYCGWALSYTCVVFYLGLRRSLWPYPFMHKLTLAGKILLGVALNFVGFACLFGVSKLYHFYVTTTLQPIVKPKELTLWDKMTLYLVY